MDSKASQDTRLAELRVLGKDVLLLVRFDANEGLSELFEFRIEAFSHDKVDLDAILGGPGSVKIKMYDQERHFHGVVVEAQWVGVKYEFHVYRLILRPWLWLCSRTSDCRFFQDKTAPEIIQEVWRDRGFTDFRLSLTESYPKLEYCVQYRETDLAFVSRLMEQHGIYYFFEHTADKHSLVLAEPMSSHLPVPGFASIDFNLAGNVAGRQHIYDLISERRLRTGKVELNDYYELTPNVDQKANKEGTARYNRSKMEFYDYPGKYKKQCDGENYAKVVLEAEQALDERRHTAGNAVSFFPGGTTKLKDHPQSSENEDYLVVRAAHLYEAESYFSGGGPGYGYSGHYEFLPKESKVFRAPIVTPKPLIHGIQTAKVVSKGGEEIDVDEYGRVLCQFFWDRKKKQSCRIRVAEVWAGKKWGGQFIPRVGQEVVVEFLEGDPDRPLVTGCVYNGECKHPYELPANRTQSGWKSNSSKGGGGYNQLRLEDKKGFEEINMRAEKDHNVKVRHAESWEIGEAFEAPTGMPSREVAIKMGDDKLKIDSGSRDTDIALMDQLKAGMMIKLECGSSKITMTPVSISIELTLISLSGALIKIN